jgi:hypothetical protein
MQMKSHLLLFYLETWNNFIDTLLLAYVLSDNNDVQESLIEDYKKLNEKCDNIISKIKLRKKQQR